jgi:hypothetical protein
MRTEIRGRGRHLGRSPNPQLVAPGRKRVVQIDLRALLYLLGSGLMAPVKHTTNR